MVRNAAQNLQWINKTLIAFIQKYLTTKEFYKFNKILSKIEILTLEILLLKGLYFN